MRKFTARQQKFIDAYQGNGVEAARAAGYQGSYGTLGQTAYELLKNPEIAKAIAERQTKSSNKLIATREERQAFWTTVMLDTVEDMRNRLKASELLGRSNADFTEKIEHSGTLELAESLKKARERVKSR